MMSMFSDLVEEAMEIFMDDFSVYGSNFENCLENLETILQRCQDKNLALNWEKCHFMVIEGIVLGHNFYSWISSRPSKGFYHKNSLATYNSQRDKKFPRTCWFFIGDSERTSQKSLDHYVDFLKKMQSLILMNYAKLHLMKLNPDWLQPPSW